MKRIILTSIIITTLTLILNAQENPRRIFLAHQGECYIEPPNTAPSIKTAFDWGSKFVEFDVAISDYGVLICSHDSGELKRYWGIDVPLEKVTMEDVAKTKLSKDVVGAERYPNLKVSTIEDIFAVTPKDGFLFVDIKRFNKDFAKKFDEALKKAGLKRSHMIIPLFAIEEFRKISKEYDKAVLTVFTGMPDLQRTFTIEEIFETINKYEGRGKEFLKIVGIGHVGFGEKTFLKKIKGDKDFFKKIKAAGYIPMAWTTHSEGFSKKLFETYGVEIICTNKAAHMRKELGLPRER